MKKLLLEEISRLNYEKDCEEISRLNYEKDCLELELKYSEFHPAVVIAICEKIARLDCEILEVERLLETI